MTTNNSGELGLREVTGDELRDVEGGSLDDAKWDVVRAGISACFFGGLSRLPSGGEGGLVHETPHQ